MQGLALLSNLVRQFQDNTADCDDLQAAIRAAQYTRSLQSVSFAELFIYLIIRVKS